MSYLDTCGYKFNTEKEREEAQRWFAKHPEMIPPKEEVAVETAGLTDWQIARRNQLAKWFGDWADTDGQTFDRVSERDAARRRLVESGGLTADEREILDALMDEWPRQEIMEYYDLERSKLASIEAGIAKKIRKARA
jgi:hypothetical protein